MNVKNLAVTDPHGTSTIDLLTIERRPAGDEQIDFDRRIVMDQVRARTFADGTL
jgi:hypothetical protein